jgi:hypothetical protein
VALEAEREVRLRAPGVEVDHHLLVHVHACIGERSKRLFQSARGIARQQLLFHSEIGVLTFIASISNSSWWI